MLLLDEIVQSKRIEVLRAQELYPVKLLEQSLYFGTSSVSLKKYLEREDQNGIIAEIKRRSPSRGIFHKKLSIEDLAIGYMQAGASALSVLTDEKYFGGSNEDLTTARKFNFCPIVRKDFIVSEYQVIEAKAIGADAVLLIAAILSEKEITSFAKLAHGLGLEVLCEVHSEGDLKKVPFAEVNVIGVNNRDLNTFKVNLETSYTLVDAIPAQITKISESGIQRPKDVFDLRQCGYQGFLIGETFMATSDPARACQEFIAELEAR